MSEEELNKTIDIVASIEVHSEVEATAKEELISYVEQLQQENEEKAKTYAKIRDEICDYLDSHRFCENFENVGNEENVRKKILGILLKRW